MFIHVRFLFNKIVWKKKKFKKLFNIFVCL